jgi:hypothetical protein
MSYIMPTQPLITIVTIVYNDQEDLEKTLANVKKRKNAD